MKIGKRWRIAMACVGIAASILEMIVYVLDKKEATTNEQGDTYEEQIT